MSENEFHKLSDELMVRRTETGDVMLYQCECSPHHPDEVQPGRPVAVLDHDEMAGLIAWCCDDETEVSPDDGLVACIVRRVRRGEMPDRIAVVALRALTWHAAVQASDTCPGGQCQGRTLEGWVMPTGEDEQE